MAKILVKLFRDPALAEQATKELRARGYTGAEIGLLLKDKARVQSIVRGNGFAVTEVEIPGIGPTVALGPIATTLSQTVGDAGAKVAALREGLGISEEIYPYYEFGLSLGGVMVSVHADGQRLAEARQVLRVADAGADKTRSATWSHSPGFSHADRTVETNPVDAKLSGDFRRY